MSVCVCVCVWERVSVCVCVWLSVTLQETGEVAIQCAATVQ